MSNNSGNASYIVKRGLANDECDSFAAVPHKLDDVISWGPESKEKLKLLIKDFKLRLPGHIFTINR